MAQATWSLSVKNSTLYFSHSKDPEPRAVSKVTASGYRLAVTIQLHDSVDIECPLHKYAVTDNLWSDLYKTEDADDFLETLDMLMSVYKVEYEGAVLPAKPVDTPCISLAETSPADEQPLNFKATVMAFHNLHPKAGKSETALLCSADTKWRKQCQAAVKPTETSRHRFGGRFKVQLAVATTSDRCYGLILEIMELFSLGKLKEQKNTKVNSCLFLETASFKDEATLYRKLIEFRNGEISKEEFNNQLKQIKQENKGTGNNQEAAAEVLVLQEHLKEKDILIQELRKQNQVLRQELDKMEMEKSQQPRRCQDQEKSQEIQRLPELDVYAFSDDDLDLQGTLVQGLLHEESAQEHHENLPIMECQDLPVICYKGRAPQKSRKIPHSSSRLRSMRKTGSDKASRIVQTEKMVETYLQRRRQNKKMSPCKFNVGMIVEALEEDGFWYKAKVLSVQKEKMKIHWTGYNYDEWLSASKIRLELKNGDEVEAPWLVHRADRYPGHVERIDGEYVHIAFNDQTKKRIHFKYVEKKTTHL